MDALSDAKSESQAKEDAKAQIILKAKENLARKEEKARQEEAAKKPSLFKVVLAQAAAEAVQLKQRDVIPPPTNDEIAQKHAKKVMAMARKGDWGGAGEELKKVYLSQFLPNLI